jgi:hypothetical protein
MLWFEAVSSPGCLDCLDGLHLCIAHRDLAIGEYDQDVVGTVVGAGDVHGLLDDWRQGGGAGEGQGGNHFPVAAQHVLQPCRDSMVSSAGQQGSSQVLWLSTVLMYYA